jgi:hypothetical protein
MFWLLYIVQVQVLDNVGRLTLPSKHRRLDRLAHISLCAQLGQDPILYYWEFLLPVEINEDDLDYSIQITNATVETGIPIISSFIALIKVFLCVDLHPVSNMIL